MKSIVRQSLWIFVLVLFLTSCGGGGGSDATDSDGNSGITYTGLTTQAQLSAANAKVMFSLLWDGEGSLGALSSSADGAKVVPAGRSNLDGLVLLVARLERKRQGDVAAGSSVAKTVNSMVPINETRSGTVSGTLTMTGSIDDTAGTGQITVTLVNFNDGDGFTQEGAATLRVAGYDTTRNVMTDATLSFSVWTVRSATSDVSLSGSMRIQESASQSGTLTINLDGRDNLGKETFRFENFVVQHGYDSQSPPSATESYRGRIYLEKLGYVVLSTESPCIYSTAAANPSNGGPIILTGAGNSRAVITPHSYGVTIEVDDNGDALIDALDRYLWSNLDGAALVSLTVTPAAANVPEGLTQQFTATAAFSDNSTQDFTNTVIWSSSDTNKVLISSSDSSYSMCWAPGCSYAQSLGSATITATLADLAGSATMSVLPAALLSIELNTGGSGAPPPIARGMTQQFFALGTFTNGYRGDVTSSVNWGSSNIAVATISNQPGSQGKASSIASGTTTIHAISGAVSGTTTLSVSNWELRDPGTEADLYRVVWTGTQFVVAGASGFLLFSSDGKLFQQRLFGLPGALYDVAWSGSTFVAVGADGAIQTSSDGAGWMKATSGTSSSLYGVVWSGNKFVAVGAYGTILTSPDGGAWTPQSSSSVNSLFGVVRSGHGLVAVGEYGTVLSSPDGTAWTKQHSGTLNHLGRVAWSGSQFVAVTGGPQFYGSSEYPIHTSPDGVTWTNRRVAADMIWASSDVAWCGTEFVVVGGEGRVFTSGDGVNWVPWVSGTRDFLSAVGCSGSQFVVTGRGGMILSSP